MVHDIFHSKPQVRDFQQCASKFIIWALPKLPGVVSAIAGLESPPRQQPGTYSQIWWHGPHCFLALVWALAVTLTWPDHSEPETSVKSTGTENRRLCACKIWGKRRCRGIFPTSDSHQVLVHFTIFEFDLRHSKLAMKFLLNWRAPNGKVQLLGLWMVCLPCFRWRNSKRF